MKVESPADLDRLSPAAKVRLSAEVVATYLRVRLAMRGGDAETAVRELRSRAERRRIRFDAPAGDGPVVAWRLAKAGRRVLFNLPGDSRCLFRSLTLISMLARRGVPQRLVIAVRPQPFAAHAWVEVDGQAVLPDADPGYERLLEL